MNGFIYLLVLPALLCGFLWLQGVYVRRQVPHLPEAPGRRFGDFSGAGEALRFWVVGESPAVGVGLAHIQEAVSVRAAERLAVQSGRAVRWRVVGYSGATSGDLLRLLETNQSEGDVDLMLLMSGVNDATSLTSRAGFRATVERILQRVWAARPDMLVIIAGVPPLSDFPALPHPLAAFLGWRAARLDQVLARLAAEDPRLHHIPCGAVVDDEFAADGFHPDARASARWAEALASVYCEKLSLSES